ncbi:hypothetical protein [Natrinema salaciae]|uniref:Uncharacterized protein n=1 Tax=Natrinema salaciae TaxID=1186196 RepID=A0A1H9QAS7_9EURY|nr:hypothetical protein [Natrinema salaciae]SER57518.1 hypothetical protein SAMN04489841_4143 [Natrinema salaciae]
MQSRRDVLRMGGGVAGVGIVAGLAGCSELPVVGSYFDDGLDYAAWTYDPEAVGSNSISTTLLNVAAILDEEAVSNKSDLRDEVTGTYGEDLSADDVEFVLSVGFAEILTGSFDGSDVVDGMGVSEEGSYGDFDLYADDEAENAMVATDGTHLIRSSPYEYAEVEATEELELLIDTYNEDADRFVDVNDDFDLVRQEVDTTVYVSLNGQTESSSEDAADDAVVTTGITAEIDGEEMLGTYLLLYKTADGIDLDETESNLENSLSESATLDDVSQDDRLVTVDFTMPTDEFQ